MTAFKKRIYSPGLFWNDLKFIRANRHRIKEIRSKGLISRTMAEKIMLAATVVNDCKYCYYGHSHMALMNGVEQSEINELLSQNIQASVNDEESIALSFAQHFAETDRNPNPAAIEQLREFYGAEKSDQIILLIRMITVGNLTGNTFDAFFSRLKGRPAENSSVWFELLLTIMSFPIFAAVIVSFKLNGIQFSHTIPKPAA